MTALDNDVNLGPLREAAASAVVGASSFGSRQMSGVGAATIGSTFRIASLSKPITAVATALAARRSGVDLDTCALEVLPELRDDWAAARDLTIADVLSQTSGLASTVTADDISRLGDDNRVFLEAARQVVRAGNARPRGQSWEYYNGNYFLAGAITAALCDTTFEDAVTELVLEPWGMPTTTFNPPVDLTRGVERGTRLPISAYSRGRRPSGGLCSTAEDLLTFGEHLLDDTELLDHVRTVRTQPLDSMRYGLGWAIGSSGQMYLNGRLAGYRTALMLLPDHHFVAVALAADSSALPAEARILSDLQLGLTGDDVAEDISTFAS